MPVAIYLSIYPTTDQSINQSNTVFSCPSMYYLISHRASRRTCDGRNCVSFSHEQVRPFSPLLTKYPYFFN